MTYFSMNLLFVIAIVGVLASFLGIGFIFYAYRNNYRNDLTNIIRLRDELIKMSLMERLSEAQRAELLPVIENAFGKANEELSKTIGQTLGSESAQAISRTLEKGSIPSRKAGMI
jgi:hypothetical protein